MEADVKNKTKTIGIVLSGSGVSKINGQNDTPEYDSGCK